MNSRGKIMGAVFGFLLAGPLGLFIGLLIGHQFDQGLLQQEARGQANVDRAQEIFLRVTFQIMGYLAKRDGRVSEGEIQLAKNVMKDLKLTPARKKMAIRYFNEGKQPGFHWVQAVSELKAACLFQRHLLKLFLEIQYKTAQVDHLGLAFNRSLLDSIAETLGFTLHDFDPFSQGPWQRQYQRQYQRTRSTYTPPPTSESSLEKAYKDLEVTQSVTQVELKKVYRRLMSQHHPDKLIAKGASEASIKAATERTQRIKEAYETICRAKGFS